MTPYADDDYEYETIVINEYLEYISNILKWVFPYANNFYANNFHTTSHSVTIDIFNCHVDIKISPDRLFVIIIHSDPFTIFSTFELSIASPTIEDDIISAVRKIIIGGRNPKAYDYYTYHDTWLVYAPYYSIHEMFNMLGVKTDSITTGDYQYPLGLTRPSFGHEAIQLIDWGHIFLIHVPIHGIAAAFAVLDRIEPPFVRLVNRCDSVKRAQLADKEFCDNIRCNRKPADLLGGFKHLIQWKRGADFVKPLSAW